MYYTTQCAQQTTSYIHRLCSMYYTLSATYHRLFAIDETLHTTYDMLYTLYHIRTINVCVILDAECMEPSKRTPMHTHTHTHIHTQTQQEKSWGSSLPRTSMAQTSAVSLKKRRFALRPPHRLDIEYVLGTIHDILRLIYYILCGVCYVCTIYYMI